MSSAEGRRLFREYQLQYEKLAADSQMKADMAAALTAALHQHEGPGRMALVWGHTWVHGAELPAMYVELLLQDKGGDVVRSSNCVFSMLPPVLMEARLIEVAYRGALALLREFGSRDFTLSASTRAEALVLFANTGESK